MAISHIASIRGSARMQTQRQRIEAARETANGTDTNNVSRNQDVEHAKDMSQTIDRQTAQISSISITSDNPERSSLSSRTQSKVPSPDIPPSLEVISSREELESKFNTELHEQEMIARLEMKWVELTKDFNKVLDHLKDSTNEINAASVGCLSALTTNVETSCDKVDAEVKAMYHLMTKCDELTTKLSIATSFRNEIKFLLKSVETLEQLYKSKAQFEHQRKVVTRVVSR